MNLQRSYYKDSVVDLGVPGDHDIVGTIFQNYKKPDQRTLTNTIEYAKAIPLGNKIIKKFFSDSIYEQSNDLISLDLSAACCIRIFSVEISQ